VNARILTHIEPQVKSSNAPQPVILRALSFVSVAALTIACTTTPAPAPTPAPVTTVVAPAPPLTSVEMQLRDAVNTHYAEAVTLLQKSVDIQSQTLDVAGVRKLGELFAGELRSLGFETKWIPMPDSVHRAGHLVAVHRGTVGPRILLIGHLDTVFEGADLGWVLQDTVGHGAGSSDMKGGDVALILALRALADAGQLKDMNVIVVMTGDEESAGRPLSISRAALIDAAKQSDLALGFEGGSRTQIAPGRRGASEWRLTVTARQSHSAGIFGKGTGYGASYEGVRILDEFRRTMAGERGLTFNIGLLAGGVHVALDTTGWWLTADGKSNAVPPIFKAKGDLRFFDDAQRDSARARMRAIVAKPLPGATPTIEFEDAYPAMPLTPDGLRLTSIYDETSRALGYPAVVAQDPESRGAGDISFVAPFIPGIDGLGVFGAGAHSPREVVYLPSLRMQGQRAAVMMSRLLTSWHH
jgi:glutamate carboxypeptidase